MTQLSQEKTVAYLEDGEFKGFIEILGAKEIILSAIGHGYEVEEHRTYFNVVVKDKQRT